MLLENIKKTNALVLKGMDYRETSRILMVFSETFGKITLIAKGIRNPKSRMGAALQSFIHSEIVIYKKENTEMFLIKEAEIIEFFKNIHNDLERFNYTSVIADFLFTFLAEEQVSKILFQYVLFTIREIEHKEKEYLPGILVRFFLKANILLGFRIELAKCTSCGKEATFPIYFSNPKGGVICSNCSKSNNEVVPLPKDVYNFLIVNESDKKKKVPTVLKQKTLREILTFFSNWFLYHNHRTLKTLDNLIKL